MVKLQTASFRGKVPAQSERRAVLVALALVLALPATAQEPLTIVSGQVHMDNLIGGGASGSKGGNATLAFTEQTGSPVEFVTEAGTGLADARNRLGMQATTTEDIIYTLDMDTNARFTTFFEPLDPLMASNPIEGFPEGWPANFLKSNRVGDDLLLFPVRCGTFGLWYNEAILAERGVSGPPTTPEELLEVARKMTFTRDNGQKVYGFLARGGRLDTDDVANMVRMFGGDIITPDYEVAINQPEAVKGITLLQTMYREGIIPPNWSTMGGGELTQMFRDGYAAMSTGGTNYGPRFNNGTATVSGHAKLTYLPLAADKQTPDRKYSEGVIFTWNVGILKGSTQKELAYDFIRYIATPEVQRQMVANENGPCSLTILNEMAQTDPDMAITRDLMAVSRAPVPGHVNMAQIRDLVGETIQNVVVNNLDVQAELDVLAGRIERLLR